MVVVMILVGLMTSYINNNDFGRDGVDSDDDNDNNDANKDNYGDKNDSD